MIDHCIRCHAERKRGLSGLGEIYALQRPGSPNTHHWLCERCVRKYTLRAGLDGKILVSSRATVSEIQPTNPEVNLRLVFRVMASPEPGGGSRVYACELMDESARNGNDSYLFRLAG